MTVVDLAQNGQPSEGRLACTVTGCEDKRHGHGLCVRHYKRWRKHGDPLRERSPAAAVLVDGVPALQIPLYQRAGGIVAHALVDVQDAVLAGLAWYLSDLGYAMRKAKQTPGQPQHMLRLHREVLGLARGDARQADHINGDRLDCRRSNLRIVTKAANAQNKPPTSGRSSRFRGVGWSHGKWRARGKLNGREYHLGTFATEEEAAAVASAWRVAHMPYTNEDRREAAA